VLGSATRPSCERSQRCRGSTFSALARGSSCCRRRLPVDEQFDAVRWLLDELPALADVMQDAIFDFEDARDARPPLQLVKS